MKTQRSDGLCQAISEKTAGTAAGNRTAGGPDNRNVQSYPFIENGLLPRYMTEIDKPEEDKSPCWVVVPRRLRKRLLRYFHDSVLTGHSSGRKCSSKVFCVATRPGITNKVLRRSRSCPAYQVLKH